MKIGNTVIVIKKNRKEGKKNRKYGRIRKRSSHQKYNAQRRDIKNKKRKLQRHCAKYINDDVAYKALTKCV